MLYYPATLTLLWSNTVVPYKNAYKNAGTTLKTTIHTILLLLLYSTPLFSSNETQARLLTTALTNYLLASTKLQRHRADLFDSKLGPLPVLLPLLYTYTMVYVTIHAIRTNTIPSYTTYTI